MRLFAGKSAVRIPDLSFGGSRGRFSACCGVPRRRCAALWALSRPAYRPERPSLRPGRTGFTRLSMTAIRLIVCRRGDRVRLFTRRGYDWTDRYPLIANAAATLACDATIDGEVVVCEDAAF